MARDFDLRHDYVVHIQSRALGFDWKVTSRDGRTASGQAPDAGSARRCGEVMIATLEALRRSARRRF